MATWIVGDIHGCADELAELLERLALGDDDRLVSVGDLFHRGPDAVGVMELLRGAEATFVLGNHELAVLARAGLAPRRPDGSDRPPLRTEFPPLAADDLVGDGRRELAAPAERLGDLLVFLQEHAGFFVEQASLPGAGPTPDGRPWVVVHAGRTPGREAADSALEDLVYAPRVSRRGPVWHEVYEGPKLVLYGHLPESEPRERRHAGRLVALGLDTGCVYGGELTAYSPELERFVRVRARRRYAPLH